MLDQATAAAVMRPIDAIEVGQRARKDMGDLAALAASIETHGLLNAITIQPDGLLVAGERRLRACRSLGWEDVPVRIVDVADLISAERDENQVRKDFTPSEAVAIARVIEEAMKEKTAAQRHERAVIAGKISAAKRLGKTVDSNEMFLKLSVEDNSRTTAATSVGLSESAYYRARKVVDAAEQDPDQFADLVDGMDRSGKVYPAYDELIRRQSGEPAKTVAVKQAPRHALLRKMHYPKPNRTVERTVHALDGICRALDDVDTDQLDQERVKEWAAELKQCSLRITRFSKRISHE